MSAPIIIKSRCVLVRSGSMGDRIRFVSADATAPPQDRSYLDDRVFLMDREDWKDFGEPDTITLTVEPGDKLNAEEKAESEESNTEKDSPIREQSEPGESTGES